jgi:hypothetical protein
VNGNSEQEKERERHHCAFEQKSDFCCFCHMVGSLAMADGGLRLTKQQWLMSVCSKPQCSVSVSGDRDRSSLSQHVCPYTCPLSPLAISMSESNKFQQVSYSWTSSLSDDNKWEWKQ